MDTDQLWSVALGQLELEVSPSNFLTWFRSTRIQEIRDGVAVIETPSAFIHEWLSKKYKDSIKGVLSGIDPNIKNVEFIVKSQATKHRPLKKHFRILAKKTAKKISNQGQQDKLKARSSQGTQNNRSQALAKTLNPKYVFDQYVVGPSNEIAHAACRAVAENPGNIYNPLFIYGGVGLGKTHLLQATGNWVLQKKPEARVLYVSSERFTNEFVQSIREGKTQYFKRFYREVDVLIIDDIQLMAGKSKTQEELFHTFNALHGQNIQVILSSDRSPRAIPTLEERLRSRLSGGMIADIQQPDFETRLAIIREKASQSPGDFEEDALTFIAKNIQKNVRELEGALNRVTAHCQLSNSKATLTYTKKVLAGILEQSQQKTISSQGILEVVGMYYNLELKDLQGKSRKKEIVRPRQIAMYLMRKENHASFPTIGESFGGRDHTTAMHACDKVEKLLEHDEDLLQELNFIRERLYA